MFHVTQSQSLDRLFTGLCDWLDQFPVGVFEKQQVIVPSHGVGVWLKQQLAIHYGLCTMVDSHFLGSFEWDCYERVLGKNRVPHQSPLNRKAMQSRLYAYLVQTLHQPQQSTLYPVLRPLLSQVLQSCLVAGTPAGGMLAVRPDSPWPSILWSLSGQIATCFAQYLVYRPGWLHQWNNGQPIDSQALFFQAGRPVSSIREQHIQTVQTWQMSLWQHLFRHDFIQRQTIRHNFWHELEHSPRAGKVLPGQVVLFTVLALPPEELKFLRRLAQYTEVHLFHYNPSLEYWADIVDQNWLLRQQQHDPVRAQLRESRHPVLSRLGKQARDTFKLLVNLAGGDEGTWGDDFDESPREGLLGHLQTEVLNLVEPVPHSYPLTATDRSLQVHVCHNRQRQLEVLREELYRLFADQPGTNPRDIVIFVPDLQNWASDIHAVFARPLHLPGHTRPLHLPYHIAGAADPALAEVWQSFKTVYTLLQAPLTLASLMQWLGLPATRAIFGLSADDLARMAELLEQGRFYCGFDPAHLAAVHQINDGDCRFTLKATLDRLTLGMVMPEDAAHQGILSMTSTRREDFRLTGILGKIYHLLENLRQFAMVPAHPDYWVNHLTAHLHEYLYPTDLWAQREQIAQLLSAWHKQAGTSQEKGLSLPLGVVLGELDTEIVSMSTSSRPGDRITFARLGTLRPLPYAHVIIMGMDAGLFPARELPPGFDLMSQLPGQLGDRARNEDDEGAFLDAILQARQSCWFFYTGFEEKDLLPRPPAMCLQYLLDWVNRVAVTAEGSGSPAGHISRIHSLYPFSPESFSADAGNTPAIDPAWLETATGLNRPSSALVQPPVIPEPAVIPALPAVFEIQLDSLTQGLLNPASHFIRQQGLFVPKHKDTASLPPLAADGLQLYQVRKKLAQLTDSTPGQLPDPALLDDLLPVGRGRQQALAVSQQQYLRMTQTMADIVHRFPHQGGAAVRHTLCLGNTLQLHGAAMPCNYRLTLRHESGTGRHLLRYWLEHLFWSACREPDTDIVHGPLDGYSVEIACGPVAGFTPVAPQLARTCLQQWLEVWHASSQVPWLLAPDLMLGAGLCENSQLHPDWQKRSRSYWNASLTPEMYAGEGRLLNPNWQFILQNWPPEQVNHYMDRLLNQYGQQLYEPLFQHLFLFAAGQPVSLPVESSSVTTLSGRTGAS